MSSTASKSMVSPLKFLEAALLPPKHLVILHKHGYRYVTEVPRDVSSLSKVTMLSIEECNSIIHVLHSNKSSSSSGSSSTRSAVGGEYSNSNMTITASDNGLRNLSSTATVQSSIVTFCKSFDLLMGGGIPTGEVTELFGEPGVGKTQFCMQLALSVQILPQLGGLGGRAVYIDTEGSFHPKRIFDMSRHVQEHLLRAAKRQGSPDTIAAAKSLNPEILLKNVNRYRVYSDVQLVAVVKNIKAIVDKERTNNESSKIRLVVIDSIAAPFRGLPLNEMKSRNRTLSNIVQDLKYLARSANIAILLINQVTTKVLKEGGSDLVGALGITWQHHATNRINLKFIGTTRCATLIKSSSRPTGSASYRVTSAGIRDIKSGDKRGIISGE